MNKESPYNVKLVDKLSAMMLIMYSCSETIMSAIEEELSKGRCKMKQEPKMIISDLLRNAKRMHSLYDRLYEISVSCGTAIEGSNIVDAFLSDKNLFLRVFMMTENAMYGATDNSRQIKHESLLKLMTTNPVFEQELIDKLTNFK